MFFFISKILSYFLNPFTWILILFLVALIRFNKRIARKLFIWSFVLMLVFSNSFIISNFMNWWEVPFTRLESLKKNYEIGIVLGGNMLTYDAENDRKTYRNNIDRLLQSVELYKEGKIEKIMISGGAGNIIYRDMLESVFLRDFLLQIGIDSNDVIIDSLSDNTHQNALYSARILNEKYPDQRYLLITSALHMRRAIGCFEKAGLQVDPYSTNKYAVSRGNNFEFLFVPDPINFVLWDLFVHEVLGYVVYDVMGYL
ncbi:MAG: YdcF family protein [Bacteroidales bacterium]|nr:YdcF family protein [Bacteroidales bacterium]MCF8387186.1 YdcF family protein [Bacteroidales bacterium]MCF8396929.1 YdcF family protein [Bacteroidales bacterium]